MAVTPTTALQASAVYGCIRCLSEDMAKLPILVQTALGTGGWQQDLGHPLVKLLRRPNRWQSCFTFMSYVVTCLQLRGNAYIFVVRDEGGAPTSLVPISPDRCEPEHGKGCDDSGKLTTICDVSGFVLITDLAPENIFVRRKCRAD